MTKKLLLIALCSVVCMSLVVDISTAADVTVPGGGTISGATTHADYPPANAFDDVDTSSYLGRWLPELATLPNAWVQYRFNNGEQYTVTNLVIYAGTYTTSDGYKNGFPKEFTLLGSNNGTDWAEVLAVTAAPAPTAVGAGYNFPVTTPGVYEYYKLVISDVQNVAGAASYVRVGELELEGYRVGPPTIDLANGPSAIGFTDATLNGRVVFTNGAPLDVLRICFGDDNGGTNSPGNWDTNFVFDANSIGQGDSFSTNITGLAYGETYYYAVYASNSYGASWSSVANFKTMDILTMNGYAMEITFTNFFGRGTLTNFPALIKLTTDNTDNYAGFLDTTDGWDLRFSTSRSGGPELKYEIEAFDTNGTSFIWVQVPELSHNTSIWALWGDANYNSQQAYTINGDVWSEGYKVVYHLNTDTADSTSTGLDAVPENGVVTGVSGIAASGIDLASGARLDLGGTGWGFMAGSGSNFTVSAWVNLDANASDGTLFGRYYNIDGGSSRWKLWADADDGLRNYAFVSLRSGTVMTSTSSGCASTVGVWQYVVATKSGNTLSVYVDAGTPNTASLYLNDSVNNRISVGTDHGDSTAAPLNGQVDEVRISTVARSADWIWAEYMNQGPNHTQFVEYGSASRLSRGTMFIIE